MPGSTLTKIYPMEGIKNPKAALSILRKDILEGIDSSQFDEIIKTCHGIPLMLKLVALFIAHAIDKGAAYSELMQAEEKWNNEGFNEMHYAFAYDALPEKCKDPFLDICSYFKRWDWDTVGNIVGKNELEMLESRALVTKDTFTGVVNVHDVILELGSQMSEKVRMTFTRASELKEFLEEQEEDSKLIKGIWLSDNKDALEISAATLDLMHKSLRVLQLGNLTKVEGNCIKKFEKLIFFKAKITQLPFDVSKSKQLGYLNYEPSDLKLSKMPSSLRYMEFDGKLHSHAFQISSRDLPQLKHLGILRLVNFSKLKNLPLEFGDEVNGLQELSLSNCDSIEKLPDSISKLRSLRILKMDSCSSLTELPVNFGSLSSLQELNLDGCSQLKALPDSVQKLSSLTLLNLSNCQKLLNLPLGLGNLTGLVELYLNTCIELKSIPESIGELKLLRTLGVSTCCGLKELAHGFCNLSFITHLSLAGCISLEELPDRFGQLASLKLLDFESCWKLKKLPEGFGQLKNLEVLVLKKCTSFEKLPEDFRCLTSLQHLDLSFCCKLEGKSMDYMVKMERLQLVHIEESEQLVKRWEEIHGDGSWSFAVISGQKLSLLENQKKNIENNLLSELDRVLTNGRREPFHVSDLPPNTLIIVICDLYPDKNAFPWALIEETIDEMKIKFQIIYIGPEFDKLPTKVKDSILGVHLPEIRANDMLEKVCLTLDAALPEERGAWYLQMHTKMVGNGKSDKYRPCWSFLTARELEEFVLGNCKRYLRLMQLVERDRQSNIELLRELFAPEGDETTPVLLKNESSQQNRTENFELKTNCGVDKLEGKTILLEMRPTHSCYDIRLQSLKEMYIDEKEKLNLEIISIPLVRPSQVFDVCDLYNQFSRTSSQVSDVFDVYKQFSREVPWFVLQNSWMVITRVVKFFLAKHCGLEEGDECEKWCPMINWIIEPNGRISIYRPSISLKDRAEVFKVLFKHLERESYQVRWGVKPCPIMHDKIEELKKEEWEHLKNMSTLNLIFNHLESISDQVKKLMFHGRLIWLYNGRGDEDISSIQNAVEQLTDNIHIIHVGDIDRKRFHLTDCIYKEYYYPLKNITEIEGMSLLNLSEHEIMTFSFRLHYLKKEINRMELCEPKGLLKGLLQYFQEEDYEYGSMTFMDYGSMTFMDEGGKVFAASLFRHDRKDRAQRLIKSMVKDFEEGKERHDQNMQTVSAAVEQENVDVYFDSLRENISEFWEVEFYWKLLKFNKEGKKWSQPKVTWPTSKSFCILKAFMSEGTNADWFKDLISRQPEEHEQVFRSYDKLKFVIKSLLNDIEEENWAVWI